MSYPPRSIRVQVGPSSRDLERRLLAEVRTEIERLGQGILERTLYVIVPSRSLRDHIARVLAEREPSAQAGVRCLTLHAIATELTARNGRSLGPETDPTGLFARRIAAGEGTLSNAVGHLDDGFRAVLPSVRDLLDAGLNAPLVDGLMDALEEDGPQAASRFKIAWAQALIRVAAGTLEAMQEQGLGRTSTLMHEAVESLWEDSADLSPSAMLVYGFADATGMATDLLEALLKRFGGTVYLEDPPDIATNESHGTTPSPWQTAARFGRRFRERILSLDTEPQGLGPQESTLPPPSARVFRAQGKEAEVREVGRRILELLDSGVRAENIGILARNLEPYRAALRIHLNRLAIPFSGLGAQGPRTAAGRRFAALRDLLILRQRTSIERWLAIRLEEDPLRPASELRIALFSLGCGRIEDLVRQDFSRRILTRGVPLRVPGALEDPDAGDASGDETYRRVSGDELKSAQDRARSLQQLFSSWQGAMPMHSHRAHLSTLMNEHLGWKPETQEGTVLRDVIATALDGYPPDFELDLQELVRLLEEPLEAKGRQRLAGAGGGVQVLDVTEARGRTFGHLFVMGLNRGTFPRIVHEDPLLPDSLRRVLAREGAGALPDLATKLSGTDEERFLFTQNLHSTDHITLSWLTVDDDGSEKIVSPLLERLRWSGRLVSEADWEESPLAPALLSRSAARLVTDRFDPRPPFEHAVLAATHGDRDALAGSLAAALASPLADDSAISGGRLAEIRLKVLDELDPVFSTSEGQTTKSLLGPFHGFAGDLSSCPGSRLEQLWLTNLEKNATCPWQFFLERTLAIQPLPDPLEALPSIDPSLLGLLVHEVLDRLVETPGRSDPLGRGAIFALQPVRTPWPGSDRFESLLAEAAREVTLDAGVSVPGFERVLIEAARPLLETARRLDFAAGCEPGVLATEFHGSVRVVDRKDQERVLEFRADRVDKIEDGLLFTDYKTGKNSISKKTVKDSAKRNHLLKAVRSGRRLQVAAYARSRGGSDDRAQYLFLGDNGDENGRTVKLALRADDAEMGKAFDLAVKTLLEARDRGVFFPRLAEPDKSGTTPQACKWCVVSQACLQGDSAARGRLAQWARATADSDTAPETEAERSFFDLWRLPLGEST